MGSMNFFEPLEGRVFLSVAASVLTGPVSKGTSRTFDINGPRTYTATLTTKVAGSVTINGIKTARLDSIHTDASATLNLSSYIVADLKNGLQTLREISKFNRVNVRTNGQTNYDPAKTFYPASMKAGRTYRYTWSGNSVSTTNGRTTTSSTASEFSIKLVSEKLSAVTVPAGKFKVYVLQMTLTTGVGATLHVAHNTIYAAPNVGTVKFVSGDNVSVEELRTYSGGTAARLKSQSLLPESSYNPSDPASAQYLAFNPEMTCSVSRRALPLPSLAAHQ